MRIKGLAVAAGLVALAAACSEAPVPLEPSSQVPPPPALLLGETVTPPFLRQAANAPALETYQVGFWAIKGQAALVRVHYLDSRGRPARNDPFLRFDIPKSGLETGAFGSRLAKGDSVYITLTIDPVNFDVDFQPTGVLFNLGSPARLQYWYQYADQDLNGDGVVDATDQSLKANLSIWYTLYKGSPWFKVVSTNDPVGQTILTSIYHFSGYAIAW